MLDVIEEGNLGLMNAVKSFADEPLEDFAPYVCAHIEDAITKAFGKSR
jgi:DNA-directed RNA polymerase sigma subunit (sigma70/sigma32)